MQTRRTLRRAFPFREPRDNQHAGNVIAKCRAQFRKRVRPLPLLDTAAVAPRHAAQPVRVVVALYRRLASSAECTVVDGMRQNSFGLGASAVAVPGVEAATRGAFAARGGEERPVARLDIFRPTVIRVDVVFFVFTESHGGRTECGGFKEFPP